MQLYRLSAPSWHKNYTLVSGTRSTQRVVDFITYDDVFINSTQDRVCLFFHFLSFAVSERAVCVWELATDIWLLKCLIDTSGYIQSLYQVLPAIFQRSSTTNKSYACFIEIYEIWYEWIRKLVTISYLLWMENITSYIS